MGSGLPQKFGQGICGDRRRSVSVSKTITFICQKKSRVCIILSEVNNEYTDFQEEGVLT